MSGQKREIGRGVKAVGVGGDTEKHVDRCRGRGKRQQGGRVLYNPVLKKKTGRRWLGVYFEKH